jgi:hypothetical protein
LQKITFHTYIIIILLPLHVEMFAKDGLPLLPEPNSGGGNLLIVSGLQDWQTEKHK